MKKLSLKSWAFRHLSQMAERGVGTQATWLQGLAPRHHTLLLPPQVQLAFPFIYCVSFIYFTFLYDPTLLINTNYLNNRTEVQSCFKESRTSRELAVAHNEASPLGLDHPPFWDSAPTCLCSHVSPACTLQPWLQPNPWNRSLLPGRLSPSIFHSVKLPPHSDPQGS